MGNENELSIPEYTEKSEQLITEAHALFEEIGSDTSILPKGAYGDEKPITVVFAGQYSAGKSTILKALTKLDIRTGHEITTEEAHAYEWRGIEVIDTPGIGTGRRPEHDEVSYKAIADADLLVYVVTYAGFDELIAQDFRRLLIDQDKAGEMVLVVNKMRDANGGNSPEQREVISRDLAKVTDPYTPDQLRAVFVDALAYLKSVDIADEKPERSKRLFTQSNYARLVETLNKFVEQRGVAARLTTPLYQLRDALDAALQEQQASCGDEDVDALEEQLRRERSIIGNAMHDIEASVRQIYTSAALDIREEGRRLADFLEECSSKADAEDMAKKSYNRVNGISEDCSARIVDAVQTRYDKCQDTLDEFYASDFSQDLCIRLEDKRKAGNPIVDKLLNSDLIAQGGGKVVSVTIGTDAAAAGLKAFTGSKAHQFVLDVGHFFGHSFKPWEAVKWAKGINVAGKALGIFGVALSVGLQVKEDYDDEKRQREMRSNRDFVRASFNKAADSLEKQCQNGLRNLLRESDAFQPSVDDINARLDEIQEFHANKSEACRNLVETSKECQGLIEEIHKQLPAQRTR